MTDTTKTKSLSNSHAFIAWQKGFCKKHLSSSDWEERFVMSRINSESLSLSRDDQRFLRKNSVDRERVKELTLISIRSHYPFIPMKHRELGYTARELFAKLKQPECETVTYDYDETKCFRYSHSQFGRGFKNNKVVCIPRSSDKSKKINNLPNYFTEKNRLQTSYQNNKFRKDLTPSQIWSSEEGLVEIVTPLIEDEEGVNAYSIRKEFESFRSESSLMPVTFYRWISSNLKSRRILDVDPRWGEFLISNISRESDVESYIGVQPLKSLETCYNSAVKNLSESPDKYSFIDKPFDELILENLESGRKSRGLHKEISEKTFDTIFFSAPAFSKECSKELSVKNGHPENFLPTEKYSIHNDWVANYIYKTCEKAWGALETGGYLIFKTDDSFNVKIGQSELMNVGGEKLLSDSHLQKKNFSNVEPSILLITALLKNCNYIGHMPYSSKPDKVNLGSSDTVSLYIWKKRMGENKEDVTNAVKILELKYSSIFNKLRDLSAKEDGNVDRENECVILEEPKTLETPSCVSASHVLKENDVDDGVEIIFDNNFRGIETLDSKPLDDIVRDAKAIKTQATKQRKNQHDSEVTFNDEYNKQPYPTKQELEKLPKNDLKLEMENQGYAKVRSTSTKKEIVDYIMTKMETQSSEDMKKYLPNLYSIVEKRVDKEENGDKKTGEILGKVLGLSREEPQIDHVDQSCEDRLENIDYLKDVMDKMNEEDKESVTVEEEPDIYSWLSS